jgi:nucleotide-binding universal stress UspA family protein
MKMDIFINKILLPVAVPDAELNAVRQAAFLARHFGSEVVLVHVVAPMSYPVGILEIGYELSGDLHAKIIERAQTDLHQLLGSELDGIAVRPLLLKGDPAVEIAQIARDEHVDLIVQSTRGHGMFYRFLLGSVAAKVLHESTCPVWTNTQLDAAPARKFVIDSVVCAVDLNPHSRNTVLRAARIAKEFGARLTLVHITGGVEAYGPGAPHIVPEWKAEIVGYAAREIAKLQQDLGTKAEVIIDSGNVCKRLNRAVDQAKGDVLVIGHMPSGGHLGENGSGYAIIRESHIPVMSV